MFYLQSVAEIVFVVLIYEPDFAALDADALEHLDDGVHEADVINCPFELDSAEMALAVFGFATSEAFLDVGVDAHPQIV